MPVRVKSISGTRTLAAVRGSGAHSRDRHVKAFQIASLELDRTRRVREWRTARDRMLALQERVREVDEIIARYRAELGVAGPLQGDDPPAHPGKRQLIRYG